MCTVFGTSWHFFYYFSISVLVMEKGCCSWSLQFNYQLKGNVNQFYIIVWACTEIKIFTRFFGWENDIYLKAFCFLTFFCLSFSYLFGQWLTFYWACWNSLKLLRKHHIWAGNFYHGVHVHVAECCCWKFCSTIFNIQYYFSAFLCIS